MNYKMVFHMLGIVLLCLAALMLLPLVAGLCFGESVVSFLVAIGVAGAAGGALVMIKPENTRIYAREGFSIVSLAWILMSLIGALPFVISGDIPNYIDALFETVSGFTTTGATIVESPEAFTKGGMFWRLFTHWIGGMGVLVFVMAILPMSGEHSTHIMRAEVPGPVVGKLVPRAKESSAKLYIIYFGLTVLLCVLLKCGGMSFYESLLYAFATAGTGGFGTRTGSIAAYNSVYFEMILSIFMLLFSVNFTLYFLMLQKRFKEALGNEEMHCFFIIVVGATLAIALGLIRTYGVGNAFRHAFFNVSTIISTTGYGTEDFTQWPEYTQWILLSLMLVGGCAGGTAGGMKLSRVLILFKAVKADIAQMIHPRSVNIVRLENKKVEDSTVKAVQTFFAVYILIIIFCGILVSFDGNGLATSATASIACISNIGPGMDKVGPMGSYNVFSYFSKLVLTAEMLMGRLEIYPLLILFSRGTITKTRKSKTK